MPWRTMPAALFLHPRALRAALLRVLGDVDGTATDPVRCSGLSPILLVLRDGGCC